MTAPAAAPPPPPRWAWLLLGAFAAGGLALRLLPLLRAGGPLAVRLDYDEGVYFSAAALLFRGVLPYRDFVFVHPPGLLYLLGLVSSLGGDLAAGLEASRFLAALLGAANVALAGALVLRRSWLGGLVAAALYATYPEAVTVERGPFLEPVLNLACLALALAWLSPRRGPRVALVAGVLCGAALAVKVWGGVWLAAALLTLPAERRAAEALQLLLGAAASVLLLVAPPALVAPGAFVEQTLLFHARRPPDGLERLDRLASIAGWPHLAAVVLALVALAALAAGLRRGGPRAPRDEAFFAVVLLVTLGGFFASSAYWPQYEAHLAPSECVLAGFGAARGWGWARRRARDGAAAAALGAALAVLLAVPSLVRSLQSSRLRVPQQLALAKALRGEVPAGACLFALEPAWGLLGGRLPEREAGAPLVVDSYGAMLLEATRGARFPSAAAAFQSPASQAPLRARLEACRFVVPGPRADLQLSEETRAWFEAHYAPVGAADTGELDLWRRRE